MTDTETIYRKSLETLSVDINSGIKKARENGECFVIAMSRKGTRLLELLQKRGKGQYPYLEMANIITEHALPFLFERIGNAENPKHVTFLLMDDAIYYGSTMLSLYREVKEYQEAYNIENMEVGGIYSAIHAKRSINFKKEFGVDLFSKEESKEGFQHYFVNNLMKELQGLNNSLEYEFPVVEYALGEDFVKALFEEDVKRELEKDYYYNITPEEGTESLNILLRTCYSSTFNKFRIYYDKNVLRVVTMAPMSMPDGVDSMKRVFDDRTPNIIDTWKNIFGTYFEKKLEKFSYESRPYRNIKRSVVIAANFLNSLYTFAGAKSLIEQALFKVNNGRVIPALDKGGLYRLFGSEEIVSAINGWAIRNIFVESPVLSVPNNYVKAVKKDTPLLIMENDCVSPGSIDLLNYNNRNMIAGAETIEEALSTVLFNTTIYAEKPSRFLQSDLRHRLHFGFTYYTLYAQLHQYYRDKSIRLADVHRWLDIRIDNGCVVPQYIKSNSESKTWERVFRPGENEELTFSHIARFVLFVWGNLKKPQDGLTDVISSNLEGSLALIYYKFGKELREEERSFDFYIERRTLRLCLKDGRYLVDWLVNNNVLVHDGKYVKLSSRLGDEDLLQGTTLSGDLEDRMKELLQETVPNMLSLYVNCKYTFNLQMKELITKESTVVAVNEAYRLIKDYAIHLNDSEEDFLSEFANFQKNFDTIYNACYIGVKEMVKADSPVKAHECYKDWTEMTKVYLLFLCISYVKINTKFLVSCKELIEEHKTEYQMETICSYMPASLPDLQGWEQEKKENFCSAISDYIQNL